MALAIQGFMIDQRRARDGRAVPGGGRRPTCSASGRDEAVCATGRCCQARENQSRR